MTLQLRHLTCLQSLWVIILPYLLSTLSWIESVLVRASAANIHSYQTPLFSVSLSFVLAFGSSPLEHGGIWHGHHELSPHCHGRSAHNGCTGVPTTSTAKIWFIHLTRYSASMPAIHETRKVLSPATKDKPAGMCVKTTRRCFTIWILLYLGKLIHIDSPETSHSTGVFFSGGLQYLQTSTCINFSFILTNGDDLFSTRWGVCLCVSSVTFTTLSFCVLFSERWKLGFEKNVWWITCRRYSIRILLCCKQNYVHVWGFVSLLKSTFLSKLAALWPNAIYLKQHHCVEH